MKKENAPTLKRKNKKGDFGKKNPVSPKTLSARGQHLPNRG